MARDWERICYEMTACWAGEEAFQHGRNVSIWSTTSIPRRSRFSAIEGIAEKSHNCHFVEPCLSVPIERTST
jgi:hypothetical protein